MANHGDVKYGNNKAELEAPNLGKIAISASPLHRLGGTSNNETPRRVSRQSMGSDRSIENSPMHHHHQPSSKASGKSSGGFSSPSWDRRNSSEGNHGLAPSTPVRSRLRSVNKETDTPDDSPAVPIFGDWDENDPKSAEGMSQIFQLVRDEKHSGTGVAPNSSNKDSYSNRRKQYGKENPKVCGCFAWCGK